jgi:uncharacterized iron-regulated protein
MRSLRVLPVLLLGAACATPARLVMTSTDTVTTVPQAAAELAKADVVVLGEMHRTPAVHRMHLDLLRALYEQRGNLVIAMEMFERDTQTILLQYLGGVIDESTFLAATRPWPNYSRDYRPVIEFAKDNGLLVLAANAPKSLVSRVATKGIESVAGEPHVARETTAPEDEYWDAFVEAMGEDAGAHAGSMPLFYAAQCLRDDTMAETIVDHLRQRRPAGGRPLCVLICGRGHSDHGRGTVARIKSRMPELDVRVLSAEMVEDLSAGVYAAPKGIADYVVVAEGKEEKAPEHPKAEVAPAVPPEQAPAVQAPAAGAPPPQNPEGQRPALGLMPDYGDQEGRGVRVATVRGGGPAEEAGIEEGDYVVALAGVAVTDVDSYTEVLDAQIIGKTITVRVRRGEAEVDLQVRVGARSR